MSFVLYLAMTAAELQQHSAPSFPIGWMACHFSPYGTGLSNIPRTLPPGSLLMVNDRTPVNGHDPGLIAAQLEETAHRLECNGIVLDFQRPHENLTQQIADAVCQLPFPVAIAPPYAANRECAVLLPPIPLDMQPEVYLSAWEGREIWLEMVTDDSCIRITKDGNQKLPPVAQALPYPHTDENMFCRYRIDVQSQHIDFHLCRDEGCLRALMEASEKWGIHRFVGLYQQLGSACSQLLAQDTARFQS